MKTRDGRYVFGMVRVGEKGQIVIPKEARDECGISPGDTMVVLGDENKNIALVHGDKMISFFSAVLEESNGSDKD
ncbi:MAG: AbrB/MazE/SpoVT family DNA-binding domain-containing protein [Clostridia bacterium]|nr:AbrB/MazE/SpoVT family DNA-binding domain-containing protein [Clostridia bacterium]